MTSLHSSKDSAHMSAQDTKDAREKTARAVIKELSGLMSICQDSYKNQSDDTLPGGWKRVMDSNDIEGNRKNGFFGAVYVHEHLGTKHYAVVFRGFSGRYDLDDVFNAVAGPIPKQVEDAYTFTKIAAATFGFDAQNATYAGHSFGGYLSKAVGAMVNSASTYSFNGIGLKKSDIKGLQKLAKSFGDDASHIDEKFLSAHAFSLYSKRDIVPKLGKYHGQKFAVDTPINAGPHLLQSIEIGFLKALHRSPAESQVEKPQVHGLAGLAVNLMRR